MPVIETQELTRRFGDLTAVDHLTLQVEAGEVFGFLGPNGAGKTTAVRMLTCLISKTSGEARIGGYEIGDPAEAMKIRRMVGIVPDNVGLYDDLTAYRNLDFYGRMYGCAEAERKERIERFLRLLGLWEKRDVVVGTFSKGMKQKIAVARALIHDPEVLFLDEPTANLDPEAAKTVRDFILDLKREKKTIFLNTHNLEEAQRLCDRIGILKTRLLATGTPSDLEGSLRPRETVVELEEVTPAILEALASASIGPVTQEAKTLHIGVTDPARENPRIIEAITRAGGRVRYVSDARSTLEDVYLRVVRGKE